MWPDRAWGPLFLWERSEAWVCVLGGAIYSCDARLPLLLLSVAAGFCDQEALETSPGLRSSSLHGEFSKELRTHPTVFEGTLVFDLLCSEPT